MKKKLVAAIMAATMAVTCLAGCGSSSSGSSSASKDSKSESDNASIRFDWWGGDTRHEATQKAVTDFQKANPNIKVEVNFGAWDGWEAARALEYQSQTGSDLTQINFSWITDYDKGGSAFVDLNDYKDIIDLSQYDQSVLDMCKDSNGGLAGIPVSITGRTFFWNKTTFDKAGIDIPKSLDDLIAAGNTFKEKLGDDYYPLSLSTYDRALLMSFYLQANTGEPIIDESGKLTVTKDQLVDGVKFIQNLEDNHVMPSIATLQEDGDLALNENPKFIDGHYAGVFEWDTASPKYVSNLAEGQEFVVGTELTGLGDKCLGVSDKVSMLFAITKSSKSPKAAAKLLNYLVNDPEGVTTLGTERGIPASKAAYDTLSKAGAISDDMSTAHSEVVDSDPLYFSPKFDDASLKDSATGAYQDVFEKLSSGSYSVDEAGQKLFDAYNTVLAE